MGFWEKFRACSHVLSSQLCFRHIVDAQEMDEKELKKGWEFGNREHTEGGSGTFLWDLLSHQGRGLGFGSWYKTDNLQVP